MSTETLYLLLGIAGAIITVLLSIIGFFLIRVIGDVRRNTEETGKNKGKIELVQQQLDNDVKRIEQTTQLELRNLAQTVGDLSNSVKMLVRSQLLDRRDDTSKS